MEFTIFIVLMIVIISFLVKRRFEKEKTIYRHLSELDDYKRAELFWCKKCKEVYRQIKEEPPF